MPAPVIAGALAGGAVLAAMAAPLGLVLFATSTAAGSTAPRYAAASVPAAYAVAVAAAQAACPALPPGLLGAQLRQESGFDPSAVSPAGAQGIAQFMPGTWATWGRDADGDGTSSPLDPDDAIDAQGRLMCQLLRAATGEGAGWGDPVDLALAGYNAGWGAVRQHRGVPPYRETTGYIAAIRGAMAAPLPPAAGAAVWPLDSPGPITNPFGGPPPRGVTYALGFHTGVDLNADRRGGGDLGQPVRAARAGIVVALNAEGPLGNEVVISHADGMYSSYAHLAGWAPGLATGAVVRTGQIIGALGCSGMSTCAPHLHLEVRRSAGWKAGTFVDPLQWLGLGSP
jgi:murein DD-endopeptidase MepM/ murein hydrolase activator NlpD